MRQYLSRTRAYASALVIGTSMMAAAAAAADLSGRVTDAFTYRPLVAVTVTLVDLEQAVRTDAEGRFRFTDLMAGEHRGLVLQPGFAKWEGLLTTGPDGHQVALAPLVYKAEEVVVTATGYDRLALDTSLPVNVIDEGDLNERVAQTMVDVLDGAPGVDVSSTGAGIVRPVIRGLVDERVLIWTDGQTKPGPGEKATPSWRRIDLRGGWDLGEQWSLTAAVENLTDSAYSDHLSRVWQDLGRTSQPGRNVKAGARLGF